MKQEPYIEQIVTVIERHYNPKYGDDRLCCCGHKYYRHFDTYENMSAVGCKYCSCGEFKEFTDDIVEVVKWAEQNCPNEYEELTLTMKAQNFPQDWLVENCVELKYNFNLTYGKVG